MDGYKMMSDSYKVLVKQGKLTPEQAEPEIRVFDFLAGCTKDDIYRLVDSSAFNEILRAYTSKACDDAGLPDEQKENVMSALRWLLDTQTAEEVTQPADAEM